MERFESKTHEEEGSMQDEELAGLRVAEQEVLARYEKNSPKRQLLIRAFCALTLGATLLAAPNLRAEEHGDRAQQVNVVPNEQKGETESKRLEKLDGYLKVFHGANLKVGEVKNKKRCPCEQLGIYDGDKHLGDISSLNEPIDSDGRLRFSGQGFIEAVAKVLNVAVPKQQP